MKHTPSSQEYYTALVNKDQAFEGIFFACIKTTGIFCRPTCTARKPKPENVDYVKDTQAALRKGYRPCKICFPMKMQGENPDWLKPLLKAVESSDDKRFKDQDIRDLNIDPARVRRWFKKNHNITFQAYLRSLRLGGAFGHLSQGGKVIDTAFHHGYDSLSGFTHAFKKLTGQAPSHVSSKEIIQTYHLQTPLGPMLAGSVESGICLLEFTDRRMLETELIDLQKKFKAPIVTAKTAHIVQLETELAQYFAKERQIFSVPLCTPGTDFQNQVWHMLQSIPFGETRSYKQQAIAVGNAKACRAVARANGENKIAIVIPCHRVIGSDGSLTGYGGGLERKRHLLNLEGISI